MPLVPPRMSSVIAMFAVVEGMIRCAIVAWRGLYELRMLFKYSIANGEALDVGKMLLYTLGDTHRCLFHIVTD